MSEKPANKTEFRFGSGLTKYNLFSFLCESFRVSKGNTTLQTGTFFWAHANFPKEMYLVMFTSTHRNRFLDQN